MRYGLWRPVSSILSYMLSWTGWDPSVPPEGTPSLWTRLSLPTWPQVTLSYLTPTVFQNSDFHSLTTFLITKLGLFRGTLCRGSSVTTAGTLEKEPSLTWLRSNLPTSVHSPSTPFSFPSVSARKLRQTDPPSVPLPSINHTHVPTQKKLNKKHRSLWRKLLDTLEHKTNSRDSGQRRQRHITFIICVLFLVWATFNYYNLKENLSLHEGKPPYETNLDELPISPPESPRPTPVSTERLGVLPSTVVDLSLPSSLPTRHRLVVLWFWRPWLLLPPVGVGRGL